MRTLIPLAIIAAVLFTVTCGTAAYAVIVQEHHSAAPAYSHGHDGRAPIGPALTY
jgi:hypothetical protein